VREVEFMPAWYGRLRRNLNLFKLLLCVSATALMLIAFAVLWARQSQFTAHHTLARQRQALADTRAKVGELDELLQLQKELLAKRQIMAELGLPVELTRVVGELARWMPASMALTRINIETKTVEKTVEQAARDRRTRGPETGAVSRTLNVRFIGVAPTEAEVTVFYARLAELGVLQEVRLVRSTEKKTSDTVMREFEVTFSLPLDYAPLGKPTQTASTTD
jgi:hypothetical protein